VAARRQRRLSILARALAGGLTLFASGPSGAAVLQPGAPVPTENAVKAAFLYHFAQLVTWPEEAADAETDPVSIAVVGRDPFGGVLEATIAGQTVRGRPIRVVRAKAASELAVTPHVLFVGAERASEAERMLAALPAGPILTVGQAKGFATRGGMVEFRLTPDSRVAFDINLRAVERAGLRMSSQLLKIARIVEEP
jgi:hypothetical protein